MAGTVLVTGAAGFIGAAVAERLLARGERVLGLDNLNPYYDPSLKRARLERLQAAAAPGQFRFEALELADGAALTRLVAAEAPDRVIHLAGCVIRSKIPLFTSRATWWASVRCWRPAATKG
jgi:UDP-glucuronate 4-epimerase